MLLTIIILLSFFGATFALRETEIFAPLRRYLFSLNQLGPFFIQLFFCPICLGAWSGAGVYMLYCLALNINFSFAMMFIWGFGSGGFNLLMDLLIQKLSWGK